MAGSSGSGRGGRVGTVHACLECGGMRPNNLCEPCPGCERLKKDQEWERLHPNKAKYLEDNGWQRLFLEKGFPPDYAGPNKSVSIGWWHKSFCFSQQIYFTLFQAVKIQRQNDEKIEPRIIATEKGIEIS